MNEISQITKLTYSKYKTKRTKTQIHGCAHVYLKQLIEVVKALESNFLNCLESTSSFKGPKTVLTAASENSGAAFL